MNNTVVKPFSVPFNLKTGICSDKMKESKKRYVKDMLSQFADVQGIDPERNDLLYEFYDMGLPECAGELQFGTSIVYSGDVNEEFYMTKGHFHQVLETAEVYLCLSGQGVLLMETPEGETCVQEMRPGVSVYVPCRHAHRSVNTGSDPLVLFFVFRGDAGHDYGTIEKNGYRKLILKSSDGYHVENNPKWKEAEN